MQMVSAVTKIIFGRYTKINKYVEGEKCNSVLFIILNIKGKQRIKMDKKLIRKIMLRNLPIDKARIENGFGIKIL